MKTIPEHLKNAKEAWPEALALVISKTNQSWSFEELWELTEKTAYHLAKKYNLKAGDTSLVLIKPGLELILTVFALIQLGVIPIIIDPGMGKKNFLKCVQRSKPNALVGNGLAQLISVLFRKEFKTVKKRVWVRKGQFNNLPKAQALELPQPKENDLAAVAFTSGSTGTPKGVCYTHGIFDAQIKLLQKAFNIQPGDVDLPMLPIFALFNPALGVTTVIPNMNPSRPAKVNPKKITDAIEKYKVTSSFGSPVLWQKIYNYAKPRKFELSTLKRIIMAGCSVPYKLIDDFKNYLPGTTVYTPYGATEALPLTDMSTAQAINKPGRGTCVGKPLPGIDIKIDPDTSEILVKGAVVTQSYYKLPEKTAASKTTDGYHKMGDVGYFDDTGNLWFCGRIAEKVPHPSGEGFLYTDCCEGLMNLHPKVRRSALINNPKGPLLVVEPYRMPLIKFNLIGELMDHMRSFDELDPVVGVVLKKNFPVDVRHNAKIHRLTLQKEFNKL